ncbi:MAG: glutaredoxin family protein [Candidatus Nanopelagicales bacterium]
MAEPRVVLIGKPDCHLCEEARVVVARVCDARNMAWVEKSLADEPGLADDFWEHIPVVLIDGEVPSRWFGDESARETALTDR